MAQSPITMASDVREPMQLCDLPDCPRQNHAAHERDGEQNSKHAAGIGFEAAAGKAERDGINTGEAEPHNGNARSRHHLRLRG